MKYPAALTPDAGGYAVTFRDIPEAMTQGDDHAEAMFMAREILCEAIRVYFDEKRPVPLPSPPRKGERLVDLPISVAAKVLLLNEMLTQAVTTAELARRLDTNRQEVNRLINPAHASKIDRIEEAMKALGRELDLVAA
jgi:antitoxin HicB